jgi:hypothetical protein
MRIDDFIPMFLFSLLETPIRQLPVFICLVFCLDRSLVLIVDNFGAIVVAIGSSIATHIHTDLPRLAQALAQLDSIATRDSSVGLLPDATLEKLEKLLGIIIPALASSIAFDGNDLLTAHVDRSRSTVRYS